MSKPTNLSFNKDLTNKTGFIVINNEETCEVFYDGHKSHKVMTINRNGDYTLKPTLFISNDELLELKDYLLKNLWR